MPDLLNALRDLKSAIRADENDAKRIGDLINRGTGGREVSLAITDLQRARHWVDEALDELAKGKVNE